MSNIHNRYLYKRHPPSHTKYYK